MSYNPNKLILNKLIATYIILFLLGTEESLIVFNYIYTSGSAYVDLHDNSSV